MGVEIIFDRKAYKIEGEEIKELKKQKLKEEIENKEKAGEDCKEKVDELTRLAKRSKADKYLLLSYHGSNNCVDRQGRIDKNWSILAYESKNQVMRRIITVSKDFETGMARYSNGRGKPESFIKNWRKTINNAESFKEFFKDFYSIEARFRFLNKSDKEELEKWELEKIESDGWKESKNYGMYDLVYSKPIESLNDFREYQGLKEEMENKTPVMKIR